METEYEWNDSADMVLVCVCCMLIFFGFLLGPWSSGQSSKCRSKGTSHSSPRQRLRSLRRSNKRHRRGLKDERAGCASLCRWLATAVQRQQTGQQDSANIPPSFNVQQASKQRQTYPAWTQRATNRASGRTFLQRLT